MKKISLFFVFLLAILILGCPPFVDGPYKITYVGTGATKGEPPKDTKEYYYEDKAIILGQGTLEKDGFMFLGWRNYNEYYFPGDSIDVYYDLTLRAVWEGDSSFPYQFTVNDKEITITGYSEEYFWYVSIPDTLLNKPVTVIGDNAFSNKYIGTLKLPKYLKHIGEGAFSSNDITHISIPDTVKTIELGAFRNNNLVTISFGSGLERIEPYTFRENNLTSISLPGNINFIGIGAFQDNDIDTITIGADVEIQNDTALGTKGASFKAFYDKEKQKGRYIYSGSGIWVKY
jgi:hypothetical protein